MVSNISSIILRWPARDTRFSLSRSFKVLFHLDTASSICDISFRLASMASLSPSFSRVISSLPKLIRRSARFPMISRMFSIRFSGDVVRALRSFFHASSFALTHALIVFSETWSRAEISLAVLPCSTYRLWASPFLIFCHCLNFQQICS